MPDRVTTSWRRRSDQAIDAAEKRSDDESGRSIRANAEMLESWEGEGGPAISSTEVLRILVVDNDIRSADSLELMLRTAGYPETQVAYSAHAALALAAEFRPDIVFLEASLLDLDTHELARLLRERAPQRELRLIGMTDRPEHAGRENARSAGFERYLLKPVAMADLSNLLAMHPDGST